MRTILFIDADEGFTRKLSAPLSKAGYGAQWAGDARTAVDMCRRRTPDLIVMEMSLPDTDGLSLLRTLRRHPTWKSIPVIAVAATAERAAVLEARRLGVCAYALKSQLNVEELRGRIAAVLAPAAPALASGAGSAPVCGAGRARSAGAPAAHGGAPGGVPAPGGAAGPEGWSAARPARARLTREETVARLEALGPLKTLPGTVAEVIAIAGSPSAERADLAAALNRDPVMAARVLRMAHSSIYGAKRGRIHSVEQAIGVIGFEAVYNLATTVGIFDAFPSTHARGAGGIVRCWQHSLAVAHLMDVLWPDRVSSARGIAYLVGLCHDLSEIVLRQYMAEEYQAAIELAAETGRSVSEAAVEVFGVGRPQLTELILGRLGLPPAIIDPIREFARGPSRAAGISPSAAALRVCNYHAHGLLLASVPEVPVSPVLRSDLAHCGLRTDALDVEALRSDVLTTTHMLTGSVGADELRRPLLRRQAVRIAYQRHPDFAAFDALALALEGLAEVVVGDGPRPPPDDADAAGTIFALPHDPPPAIVHQASARPRLFLVASPEAARPPADVRGLPVSLAALEDFVTRCRDAAAGGPRDGAQGVAGATEPSGETRESSESGAGRMQPAG